MAEAIREAALEVAAGKWNDQFPVDVFQTGSGTSSNMNANEVIATLATERLGDGPPQRPRQRVAVVQRRVPDRDPHRGDRRADQRADSGAGALQETLAAKAPEFATVVKTGRTHLMDATPVTLGQEFGGYAAQVRYGIERIEATLPRVARASAGRYRRRTGINTPAGFAAQGDRGARAS